MSTPTSFPLSSVTPIVNMWKAGRSSGTKHLRIYPRSWIVRPTCSESDGFEHDLGWAPRLDGRTNVVRMPLASKQLKWFERTAFQATKVRNVSNVGSQNNQSLPDSKTPEADPGNGHFAQFFAHGFQKRTSATACDAPRSFVERVRRPAARLAPRQGVGMLVAHLASQHFSGCVARVKITLRRN
jgi:hypothetical protein